MANKKAHGVNNKELSNDLYNRRIYYDWVVTVSFYSAIHFVEDKILPITIEGNVCDNISKVRKALKLSSRHAARLEAVRLHAPQIHQQYSYLDGNSRTARYITFKIHQSIAAKAQQYLNEIEKACYPAAE